MQMALHSNPNSSLSLTLSPHLSARHFPFLEGKNTSILREVPGKPREKALSTWFLVHHLPETSRQTYIQQIFTKRLLKPALQDTAVIKTLAGFHDIFFFKNQMKQREHPSSLPPDPINGTVNSQLFPLAHLSSVPALGLQRNPPVPTLTIPSYLNNVAKRDKPQPGLQTLGSNRNTGTLPCFIPLAPLDSSFIIHIKAESEGTQVGLSQSTRQLQALSSVSKWLLGINMWP